MSNVMVQFLDNMAKATVTNKDRIIEAAFKAYAPKASSVYYMDNMSAVKNTDGSETYFYMGDPVIRFLSPTFGWQQKTDSTTFNATLSYEILFDLKESQ